MKLKTISTFILGLIFISSFAQNKPMQKEKITKLKAIITERLELTPDEATAFWPVYKQRRTEKHEKIKTLRKKGKKKIKEMSNDEVLNVLNNMMKIREINLEVDKKYHQKFLEILPPKKVAKLYFLEKRFKQHKKKKK